MDKSLEKPLSLRDRQRAQTRTHLLEIAVSLIGADGFNGTSIDDLAKAAGTSRATVYSYFETKEAILDEITRVCWDSADDMYREFGELNEWNRTNILDWLSKSVLVRWEHDWPLHRARMKSSSGSTKIKYRDYADRYVDSLTRNASLWQARFSQTETRRRALMLISMVDTYMWNLMAFQDEPDQIDAMETLSDVFLEFLRVAD